MERLNSHHAASSRSTPCSSQHMRNFVPNGRTRRPSAFYAFMLASAPLRCVRVASGAREAAVAVQLNPSIRQTVPEPCVDEPLALEVDEVKVITKFIAETLLPTKHGKFRLRGYKHSVSADTRWRMRPTGSIW